MPYIEKYVYDWVTARDRALKATCVFDGKNFHSSDPEAWVQLSRAEQALDRFSREWLGFNEVEAVAGVEPTSGASKDPYPPRETAIDG